MRLPRLLLLFPKRMLQREMVMNLRTLLPMQLVVTRLLLNYFLVYQNFLLPFPLYFILFYFIFEGPQCVFGLYILTLKQSSCPICFWALNINRGMIFSMIIRLCHCLFYLTFDGCFAFPLFILGHHLFILGDLCLQRNSTLSVFHDLVIFIRFVSLLGIFI